VDETESTNFDLAARARADEPAGLVLVAEHQTAGRGRLDRTWETPPRAALTFSVLIRPRVEAEQWPWLPLLAGLAAAKAVRQVTGLATVGLKWPNDLMVEGLKAGGILLERVESAQGPAAVIGIGINVTTGQHELPVPTATSLALAGATPDRRQLLIAVLYELAQAMGQWAGDPDWLRTAYSAECLTIGQEVVVSMPDGSTITGKATGIDADGRLEVETDNGPVAVGAGDVVHVR